MTMLGPASYPQPSGWGARGSVLRAGVTLPRRPLLALTMLSLAVAAAALAVVVHQHPSTLPTARSGNPSHAGLSSLPLAAQGPVSATLGAHSRAYRVGAAGGGGFAAANPAQRLSASFGRSGVSIRSGSTRVGLRVGAVGYGSSLQTVGPVAPRGRDNRAVYSRAGLQDSRSAAGQGRLKQTLLWCFQGRDVRLACHKRPVPTCAPQLVSSPQYRNEPTTTIMFGTDGQKL